MGFFNNTLDKWNYSKLDDQPIRTAYNMRRCWNNEDKLKLIYLAEKHNVLWDTSYVYYRELTRRKKALDEIRQQFDDKYCVTDINSQWRNLKDVFYKKKASYEQMAELGEHPEEPIWRFYEPLKFLLRCDDVRKRNLRKRYTGIIEMAELHELRMRSKQMIMQANARRQQNIFTNRQTSLDVFGSEGGRDQEDKFNNSRLLIFPSSTKNSFSPSNRILTTTSEAVNSSINSGKTVNSSITSPAIKLGPKIGGEGERIRNYNIRFGDSPLLLENGGEDFNSSLVKQEPIEENEQPHSPVDIKPDKNKLDENLNNKAKFTQPTSKNVEIPEKEGGQEINLNSSNNAFRDTTNENKFKFFGKYVETALLDIHHQNPHLARKLVENLYGIVGNYQNMLNEEPRISH